MVHISAHVLDTVRGKAARGVRIELFREDVPIKLEIANQDGRTDTPLLADGTIADRPLRTAVQYPKLLRELAKRARPALYDVTYRGS